MSTAIAALAQWDGRPVDSRIMQAANDCVRFRCPDGAWVWSQGSIALAQADLATLPEDLPGEQISVGEHRIVASCRLDNRVELSHALPDHLLPSQQCDAGFILAAYLAWDTACLDHLLGPFAFVIWDGTHRRLFAARDLSGARPLYYYADDKRIFIASEHTQILQDPTIPFEVDEEQVAEFLTPSYQWTAGWNLGFLRGFSALPAGHYLLAESGDIEIRPFWTWETQSFDTRPEDVLIEEYLELLRQALNSRLRSRGPIAMELSGGLDSSALVCLAALHVDSSSQPLHTVSLVFDQVPETNERQRIQETLDSLKVGVVKPHFLDGSTRFAPHCFYDDWSPQSIVEPQLLLATAADDCLGHLAVQSGCNVVITGEMGDSLNEGIPHIFHDLFRYGHWGDAIGRLKLAWRQSSRRAVKDVFWYGLVPFAPDPLYRQIKRSAEIRTVPDPPLASYFTPDFERRTLKKDREIRLQSIQRWQPRSPAVRALLQDFVPPMPMLGAPTPYPLELRHPYTDRRLLEFSLSLPPQVKWENQVGDFLTVSRHHHRRAMRGILPDSVRCDNVGVYFDPAIENSLSSHALSEWFRQSPMLHIAERGYVQPKPFLESVARSKDVSGYLSALLCFEAWLRALDSNGKLNRLIPARHH